MLTKKNNVKKLLQVSFSMLVILIIFKLSAFTSPVKSNDLERQNYNFNTFWQFSRTSKINSQTKWETVHLPHSPTIEEKEFDTHWQGICYYKRQFHADKSWQGKKISIKFEAVMQKADIWVNGKLVKTHKGGFLPFSIDISNFIDYNPNKVNEVIVKADNQDMPNIPPGKPLKKMDMTYLGGIYRSVNLIVSDKLHITNAVNANKVAGGGIFVSYPEISTKKAQIKVQAHVKNDYNLTKNFILKTQLKDKSGNIISETIQPHILTKNSDKHFSTTLNVNNPHLWSTTNPYLYTINTLILNSKNNQIIDNVNTRIGIRTIDWRNDGFYLNDKKLILNGANRHQDNIYIGNAASENVQRLDALKLREAGFNNVRAGHYPLDPAFMDACDEYGLTVIVCNPGWQFFKNNSEFKNNSYKNIQELYRRDRNHPSVILYELTLNESWYNKEFATKAKAVGKAEMANAFISCDYKFPDHEMYDVNYKVPLDIQKPTFTREWGDDNRYCGIKKSNKGYIWGDWARRDDEKSMIYQSLARQKDLNGDGYWDWFGVNANPNTAGYALWVGFDHNRGGRPDIARCGVWGLDRYPKFCHYFLQSQRDPNEKLINIDSGPTVFIANFFKKDSPKEINVYSNCDTVKLFLNGKLIGKLKPDMFYNEGDNGEKAINHVPYPIFTFKNLPENATGILTAEGIINGNTVAEHSVRTPEKAVALSCDLDSLNKNLIADGSDMALLFIKAIDKNGTLNPNFNNTIELSIKGEGRLIGDIPVQAEGGIAAVWLRSTTKSGDITITASSKSLKPVSYQTTTIESNDNFVKSVTLPKVTQIRTVTKIDKHLKNSDNLTKFLDFEIKASSTKNGYSTKHLNDGNLENWWYAENNNNQEILLTLKNTQNLAGSRIIWEKDSTWYNFEIYVSNNGLKWKKVYNAEETGHDFNIEKWHAKNIKYVKIKFLNVRPKNSLLGVKEIELYK